MTGLSLARAFGVAVLATLCSLLVTPALASASAPKYVKENAAAYERQLQKGEVSSAVFNLKIRSLRITLKDGKHFRYSYPPNDSSSLESQLHAKGVSYRIKKKGGSHKIRLRYIVGGALLLVIVIIAVVLFFVWRRRRTE